MRPPPLLHRYVLALCVVCCVAVACGSLKRQIVPATTSAGVGVGIAWLVNPIAGVIATAATASIFAVAGESDRFESGEVVGEEALRREMLRWRGEAGQWKEDAIAQRDNVARAWGETARKDSWWKTWAWRALGVFLLAFTVRNRVHLLQRGPGRLRRLAHAIFGPRPKLPKLRITGRSA